MSRTKLIKKKNASFLFIYINKTSISFTFILSKKNSSTFRLSKKISLTLTFFLYVLLLLFQTNLYYNGKSKLFDFWLTS